MHVIWQGPAGAPTLVLAHGAGAGMTHRGMQAIAEAFERHGIATLRFNFPFVDARRKRVDSQAVTTACIRQAFTAASERAGLPIWLGGHSFGGRMASHAVLDEDLEPAGLIFCGFPLHPAGKPATSRAQHLFEIRVPMLFLSGTRDKLAERELLEPVVTGLPTAELHWLEKADHGYRILKRTRESSEDVFDEIARVARDFIDRHNPNT